MGGGILLQTTRSSGWRSGRRAAAGGTGVGAGGGHGLLTAALCTAARPSPLAIAHAARDRQVRSTRPAVPRAAAAIGKWLRSSCCSAEGAVERTVALKIDYG